MQSKRVGWGLLGGCVIVAGLGTPGCDAAKSLVQRVTGGGAETPAASSSALPEIVPSVSIPIPPVVTAAPSAPAVVLADATASNEAKVKHFADEKKLDKAPAKISAEKVEVREDETATSAVIATLPRDAEVIALAERGGLTLGAFRNPAKPEEVLQGWMASPGVAVTPSTPSTADSSTAAAPEVPPAPSTTTPEDKSKLAPTPGSDKGTDKGKPKDDKDKPKDDKGKAPDKDKDKPKDDPKDKDKPKDDKVKTPDKDKPKDDPKDKDKPKDDKKKGKTKKQKGDTL